MSTVGCERETHTSTGVKGRGDTLRHKDTMVYGGCVDPQLDKGIVQRVFLASHEWEQ